MKRLTVDEVRAALPDLDELRPILDALLMRSEPDDDKAWAGSGALGTAGGRAIPEDGLAEAVSALAQDESRHLLATYARVGRALSALAAGEARSAAATWLEAASVEEARDRPARADAYADAAYRALEDDRDRTLAALACRRSARARRTAGDLDEALRRYRRSQELALGMSDHRGAAEAAIGAGNVLEDQGRWDDAERSYRKALDVLEAVAEPVPERWHALINLHILARSRGQLDESEPLLERALEAAREAGDDAGAVPFIENARGQLLMARGDFDAAERHLRTAIEASGHARARVQIRINLAESLLARGRLLDAAEHTREAEREAIRSHVVTKLPEVYRLLGRIAAADGNPDAFVLFERSLEIVRERGPAPLEEALTLSAYAEAEARRGEEEAARQLRQEARSIFDRLGITNARQRWADVFGPASENPGSAQEGT